MDLIRDAQGRCCRDCGYFTVHADPALSEQFGRCGYHPEDIRWIAPPSAACEHYTLQAPAHRRFVTILVLALFVDVFVVPVSFWVLVMTWKPAFVSLSAFWPLILAILLSGAFVPFVVIVLLIGRGGVRFRRRFSRNNKGP